MVRGIASQLLGAGVLSGDRVLISVAHPADFLAAFFAVQSLAAIPVPVPPPALGRNRGHSERTFAIAKNARPTAIIADSELSAPLLPCVRAIVLPVPSSSINSPAPTPRYLPHEVAFIQYTSGSTGAPKGVVVTQFNLTTNLHALVDATGLNQEDTVFSWLPLFHDMGLIAGLLLGVYLGIPTYVAKPDTFVTRPESWLLAMSALEATFSLGPNFAYHTLAHRASTAKLAGVDLSRWRIALSGGELVDPETVRSFTDRYKNYGLRDGTVRPGYGLAECTLAVTVSRPGDAHKFDVVDRRELTEYGRASASSVESPATHTIASVGSAVLGHFISIVDPLTGSVLADRHLGEVVVRGPSVTPGYFDEPTHETARERALRTGDIGYLVDNDLYIVDRLKDLLIVAGRKYATGDVERVVGTLEGIRNGSVAAFSVRGASGTEEVVVVASPERPQQKAATVLLSSILTALREHLGLSGARVFLVRRSAIPRTSSGKIRRSRCRALLDSGALELEHAHTMRHESASK